MDANIEIIAKGSYEDALNEGQKAADKLAKGATDITISARKLKKTGYWKVILKYKRELNDNTPFDFNHFLKNLI
ncbi:hypothetical protein [Psychrobacter aquaticus]|uniref:Uncharacterized protein n=1 Tax=Psychrobacter aquaticus CMS 56 TaxID=1354303 RepID=U4T5J3_9GAMM|nr:hypothetical protein [Psychrobacter aquaticus]ERL56170.1 hypothetical protein M917_0848 [Psychrobacter aquaticus CMS 56]